MFERITKLDLINQLSVARNISKTQARILVETFFSLMATALDDNKDIFIQNFGSFKHVQRGARTGRNPKTGETIDIPAKVVVKFRKSASSFN